MRKTVEQATAVLKIHGLSGLGRAERLRRAVNLLDGVSLVDINYILDNVTINYDPGRLTLSQVKSKLNPVIRPVV